MLCRRAGDLAGNAAQTLLDELLQTPAGAVAGEHRQIVQMELRVAMGIGNLLIINLAEPIIRSDGAGIGENQAADGIGHGRILLDAPVCNVQVAVHQALVVQNGGAHSAELLPVLAVKDISLGNLGIARPLQNRFHAILNGLDADLVVDDLGRIIRRHLQGQQVDDILVIGDLRGIEGLGDRVRDAREVELHRAAISLDDFIHLALLSNTSKMGIRNIF